ncbi:calcium-binding protein [Actinorhabdospora filicis]|uniref:Calcium-binding protein n=1 Tax=Actinorhabdospora filicis TaxID=1785913 RepID=A0A9W6SQ59_9ACTN|nr:EF-hand domain-containing protein [Actinorhabdospora filicis]GLZ79974.1 calcium-binding protein [Actinorhabdospora filicis]
MSDEYQSRLTARFDALDRDGDGAVTFEDFAALASAVLDAVGEPVGTDRARALSKAAWSFYKGLALNTDVDRDGQITREEFLLAADVSLRGNPEGFERVVRPWAEAVVAVADRDGDGRVSRAEWVAVLAAMWLGGPAGEDLPGLDADEDGRITARELLDAAVRFYTDPRAVYAAPV